MREREWYLSQAAEAIDIAAEELAGEILDPDTYSRYALACLEMARELGRDQSIDTLAEALTPTQELANPVLWDRYAGQVVALDTSNDPGAEPWHCVLRENLGAGWIVDVYTKRLSTDTVLAPSTKGVYVALSAIREIWPTNLKVAESETPAASTAEVG